MDSATEYFSFYFANPSEFRFDKITSWVTVVIGSILMGVYDGDSVLKLILERLYRLDFLFEYLSTFSSAENCDSLEACMLFERILQQVNGCDYVLFFMALLGLLGSIFSGISWYGNHLLLQLKSGWFMERKVEREQYMCCYCCKVFNFWSKCIKPHTFNTSTIFYHGFCQMHLKTSIHLLLKQWGDTGKLYVKISERNKLVLQIFPKKCEFLSVFFLPVPTVWSSHLYLSLYVSSCIFHRLYLRSVVVLWFEKLLRELCIIGVIGTFLAVLSTLLQVATRW